MRIKQELYRNSALNWFRSILWMMISGFILSSLFPSTVFSLLLVQGKLDASTRRSSSLLPTKSAIRMFSADYCNNVYPNCVSRSIPYKRRLLSSVACTSPPFPSTLITASVSADVITVPETVHQALIPLALQSFFLISRKFISKSIFLKSFGLIFCSELGDKTFWMSAMFAARYGRLSTFIGVLSAVLCMASVASVIGLVFRSFPLLAKSHVIINLLSSLLFAYFGVSTLYEALNTSAKVTPQSAQTSAHDTSYTDNISSVNYLNLTEAEASAGLQSATAFAYFNWVTIAKIFSVILSTELGDRSFMSTLTLSTTANPLYIMLGTITAHISTTLIAINGGVALSKIISERTMNIFGGSLYLLYSVLIAAELLRG